MAKSTAKKGPSEDVVTVKPEPLKDDKLKIKGIDPVENPELVIASDKGPMRMIAVVMIAILIIVAAVFLLMPRSDKEAPTVAPIVPVQPALTAPPSAPVVERISFAPYLESKSVYHNKPASVKGRLRHYIDGNASYGIIVYAVVDDNNKEIELAQLTKQQKDMFMLENITTKYYNVTGTFMLTAAGFEIYVSSIQ
jgi:hypothetical protein